MLLSSRPSQLGFNPRFKESGEKKKKKKERQIIKRKKEKKKKERKGINIQHSLQTINIIHTHTHGSSYILIIVHISTKPLI
jgi:hypothetical protein